MTEKLTDKEKELLEKHRAKQQKKEEDFSKKWVRRLLLFTVLFVIVILILFWKTGNEPSVLIGSVFAMITGELWSMATIKKSKIEREYEE
ncbi:hypothetical protein [Filifactor alocis]|uniref:hypothetical protein n=1 Tax=Filifactor alocis TaxID=143361 RepID=UPI003F9EC06A